MRRFHEKLQATAERGCLTDEQLTELLPTLPREERLAAIIAKYVGGASSVCHDGETPAHIADARIALELVRRMQPWLEGDPGPPRTQGWARRVKRATRAYHYFVAGKSICRQQWADPLALLEHPVGGIYCPECRSLHERGPERQS
jgi:hypothetical protein